MFMNSGNAHTTVSVCSSLALVGMTDGMEGVSVAVEWRPRCVLETEGRTDGAADYLSSCYLGGGGGQLRDLPDSRTERERDSERGRRKGALNGIEWRRQMSCVGRRVYGWKIWDGREGGRRLAN